MDYLALGRLPFTPWHGGLKAEDKNKISSLAQELDLESLLDKEIGNVSDGEKQRALLGRGLLQDPQFILLDEPTVYLDVYHRYKFMGLLQAFSKKKNIGVVFSTHDLDIAWPVADHLLLFQERQLHRFSPQERGIKKELEKCLGRGELRFNIREKRFEFGENSKNS